MSYAYVGGLGATSAADYIAQLAQAHSGDDGGYSDKAVTALNMIVADPNTQNALAPLVRTGLSIFQVAQQQWSAVSGASGGQLRSVLLGFVNDITASLAKNSQMIGEAIGAMGEVIPIIGQVVSMIGTAKDLMDQAHSAYMQQQVQCCITPGCAWGTPYTPVVPTGSAHMMPADVFVNDWQGGVPEQTAVGPTGKVFVLAPAVAPTPVPTSLGLALISVTEGSPGSLQWAKNFGAKGIPAATQQKFKAMRLAIEASAVHPELTDGGTKIWPIYLDLLRAEFDNGDLTPAYAKYLWVLEGSGGTDAAILHNAIAAAQGRTDLMSPFEVTGDASKQYTGYMECKKYDQRAFNGLLQLVTDWRNVALPKWGSDRAALSAQLAKAQADIAALAKAEAQKRLGAGGTMQINLGAVGKEIVACVKAKGTWGKSGCTTTRQGVVWSKPQLAFVTQPVLVVKKSSALAPILFGLVAVGSIVWMAKHRKHRATA